MATLQCNSCGGNISSSARRVQCPHCGELFPFACARCNHKLRPPFSVFDDERYLTFDTPPQPLCNEHYLRQCPDCNQWFSADANRGYFRCLPCAQVHPQTQNWPERIAPVATPPAHQGGVATKARAGARTNSNAPAILFAVCAFAALTIWMIVTR